MFYSKNKLQIVIFVLISLVAYKIFAKINSRFEVFYQINIKNEKILNLCSSLKAREFYPTLYLRNGLLQAFFGSKSKYLEDSSIFFKKEYI